MFASFFRGNFCNQCWDTWLPQRLDQVILSRFWGRSGPLVLEFFKKWWANRRDYWANCPTSTLLKKGLLHSYSIEFNRNIYIIHNENSWSSLLLVIIPPASSIYKPLFHHMVSCLSSQWRKVNLFLTKTLYFNPPGTKGFGTHTKHQGGVEKDPPSISRTRNATNLKPLEGLGVSFKVSKNFKLV